MPLRLKLEEVLRELGQRRYKGARDLKDRDPALQSSDINDFRANERHTQTLYGGHELGTLKKTESQQWLWVVIRAASGGTLQTTVVTPRILKATLRSRWFSTPLCG